MKKYLFFLPIVAFSLALSFCNLKKCTKKDTYSRSSVVYTTDLSNYWQDAQSFLNRYSSTPDIDKNTIISIGRELEVIGFYPDILKTADEYIPPGKPNSTPWVIVIAIGKSEFKIEKNPQELGKKTQIGILDKCPFFIVEMFDGGVLTKFDFYFGSDLPDPLANEDNTGGRAKGFVGSLWFGYGHDYQAGIIAPVSSYKKEEMVSNSKGIPVVGYFINSDYYLERPLQS
jgi:hypothetical protein